MKGRFTLGLGAVWLAVMLMVAVGCKGAVGLPGDIGSQGEQGADGIAGPQGETGPQGPAGEDGADGTDGQDGTDGEDGTDGADGQDGEDGADGQDGTDGEDGADGAPGPQGPPGIDALDSRDGTIEGPASDGEMLYDVSWHFRGGRGELTYTAAVTVMGDFAVVGPDADGMLTITRMWDRGDATVVEITAVDEDGFDERATLTITALAPPTEGDPGDDPGTPGEPGTGEPESPEGPSTPDDPGAPAEPGEPDGLPPEHIEDTCTFAHEYRWDPNRRRIYIHSTRLRGPNEKACCIAMHAAQTQPRAEGKMCGCSCDYETDTCEHMTLQPPHHTNPDNRGGLVCALAGPFVASAVDSVFK